MKYIFYFIIYCLLLIITSPVAVIMIVLSLIVWDSKWAQSITDLWDLWWDYMFND